MTQPLHEIEPTHAPAPRPLDARARRRAWNEPSVRFWWLLFIAVLLIAAYVALDNYRAWAYQRDLIVNGTKVEAFVAELDGVTRVFRAPPTALVTLTFTLNGVEHRVQGTLEGREDYITTREIVSIRVDPADPTRWTYATAVPSLARQLAMALLLLPVVLILGAVALWRRARVLGLWKNGAPAAMIVAHSQHTALAPFSRYVQGALRDGADKRLIGAYVPQRQADPQRGDVLWFIVDDAAQPRRAIYAGAFS